jgi:hypothetical protein
MVYVVVRVYLHTSCGKSSCLIDGVRKVYGPYDTEEQAKAVKQQ